MIVNLKQSAIILLIGLILLSPILSLSGNTFNLDNREIYSFMSKDTGTYPENPDKKTVDADSIQPEVPEMMVTQDHKPVLRYPPPAIDTSCTNVIDTASPEEVSVIQDDDRVVDIPQPDDSVEDNDRSDTRTRHNKKKVNGFVHDTRQDHGRYGHR